MDLGTTAEGLAKPVAPARRHKVITWLEPPRIDVLNDGPNCHVHPFHGTRDNRASEIALVGINTNTVPPACLTHGQIPKSTLRRHLEEDISAAVDLIEAKRSTRLLIGKGLCVVTQHFDRRIDPLGPATYPAR
jgi:hypothetical protein